MAIDKGVYIKSSRKLKAEFEKDVTDLKQQIKKETDKYHNYRKYTDAELKLMKVNY